MDPSHFTMQKAKTIPNMAPPKDSPNRRHCHPSFSWDSPSNRHGKRRSAHNNHQNQTCLLRPRHQSAPLRRESNVTQCPHSCSLTSSLGDMSSRTKMILSTFDAVWLSACLFLCSSFGGLFHVSCNALHQHQLFSCGCLVSEKEHHE